jgi:4-amino-4-deoxy-L-arabinose transferase-like glycosyltransferase
LRQRSRLDPWLAVLLAVFCLLAGTWAFVVPAPVGADAAPWGNFNPDEATHLATVRYMARHGLRFPPYNLEYLTSHHPPLYYTLGAAVHAAVEPWGGEHGAVLALRLMSVLMGAGTVALVYAGVRSLTASRAVARLAAAVAALVPMFVAMSAAVNNDCLAALTATAALAACADGLRRGFTPRRTLLLSLLVAANVGTKVTGLGLIPASLLALWWDARRRGLPARAALVRCAAPLAVTAVLTGWWFVRNTVVYGDPLRQKMHEVLMGTLQPGYAHLAARGATTAPRYAWFVTTFGWRSFWGVFDSQSRLFPVPLYVLLALLQAATATAFAARLLRRLRRPRGRLWPAAVAVITLFCVLSAVIFYRFNWAHLTPQGRYYFTLLLPFGLVTAAGWRALFPRRLRDAAGALLVAVLLLLNLWVLREMAPWGGRRAIMSTAPAAPSTAGARS